MSIDNDIVELLEQSGPLHASEVRSRLGVASAARFDVAVMFLVDERKIERVSGGKELALRMKDDARPVPEAISHFLGHAKSVRRRAGARA